jgi:hypothetical protein
VCEYSSEEGVGCTFAVLVPITLRSSRSCLLPTNILQTVEEAYL